MTPEVAIQAGHVTAAYGRRVVLRDVSFAAHYGEVTAILGPNGAGKSTLLRVLAGLVACDGTVLYGSRPLSLLTRPERARFAAYVPQRSDLDAALSVREVVEQGRHPHRGALSALGKRDHVAVEAAMASTGIGHLDARRFTELSGGEQRRVLLSRALATEASVVLLDEPTESLDISHTLDLYALLADLALAGRAIVSVMHGLDDARRYTQRAVLLRDGQIASEGDSRSVVVQSTVRSVYSVDLVEGGALGFRRTGEAAE
jgi:iron complex transport system ATP-binding protein